MNTKSRSPIAIAAMTLTAAFTVFGAMPSSARDIDPAPSRARPHQLAQPSTCHNCGVVQSVETVQRQGRPQGMAGTQITPGMAIGGVVGGLLGNQVGHGNGRAAATVVGAAGGAYAGNAIEKNRARYTAQVMHIRMRDGSMRTVEQRNALPKGTSVVIEGNVARRAQGANG